MRKIYAFLLFTAIITFLQVKAQTPLPGWNVAGGGAISSALQIGNTIYIGGAFTYVGPNVPYGASISTSTGAADLNFAKPNGNINAVAPDGSGGWYIGGTFTKVGNVTRNYIARINADGTVNSWNPNASGTNANVFSIAVNGSTIYVGGTFTSIGGQTISNIAALDATSGAADPAWNPTGADNTVRAIAVSGSTVYVGGLFATIGGQARNKIAALDASTGAVDPTWNPNANNSVFALAVKGSTLYAGGNFTNIGGQNLNRIAALDISAGSAGAADATWNPNSSGGVFALAISGSTLYAGGLFSGTPSIGGLTRKYLAALDIAAGSTGAAVPGFDANVTGATIPTIAVNGSTLYVGGTFTSIGGQTRNNIAALDATTGTATSWDPSASANVQSIAVNGSTLYAGGSFVSVGGQVRNRLAALDATTGAVTNWNPGANGAINSLVAIGSTIYAGGGFTFIGGQFRSYVAALDASTGSTGSALTAFNATPTVTTLYSLATDGSTLYVGGTFTNMGGQARSNIAALNSSTGIATNWNPGANGSVNSLTVNGSIVYAGGNFTTIGGLSRTSLAALDGTTNTNNAIAGFTSSASNTVYSLVINGSTLYAGGNFITIGGMNRNYIAALDPSTGTVSSWNPNANGVVRTIAVNGSTVYAGGNFTAIGGQTRNYIAALDNTTGNANPSWDPNAGPIAAGTNVYSLVVNGSTIYAGGNYTSIGSNPISSITALSAPIILPLKLLSFTALLQSTPSTKVVCNWVTAEEVTTSHFIVERSADGKNYSAIGRVNAAGNSSNTQQYSFTDQSPLEGVSYYRLKQFDQDGSFTYSKVVVISTRAGQSVVLLYPNPAKDEATLIVSVSKKEQLQYMLFDQGGRMMISKTFTLNPGSNQVPVPVKGLSKGLYIIKLQGPTTQKQLQLVKQ